MAEPSAKRRSEKRRRRHLPTGRVPDDSELFEHKVSGGGDAETPDEPEIECARPQRDPGEREHGHGEGSRVEDQAPTTDVATGDGDAAVVLLRPMVRMPHLPRSPPGHLLLRDLADLCVEAGLGLGIERLERFSVHRDPPCSRRSELQRLERSAYEAPAVDYERLPVDHPGVIGGEPHHRRCNGFGTEELSVDVRVGNDLRHSFITCDEIPQHGRVG